MGEVAASKTQDQKFDVQHSKSEFRKGKGRNHEANAKDEAKPLPVHVWPTLGAKPTTVAQVPGGAWGKTGGAVKQLKEAEEMKHVKKRQQKPEEEEKEKDAEDDDAAQERDERERRQTLEEEEEDNAAQLREQQE